MSMNVAVVGAGIMGLAHAWSAAQRHCKVTVYDRSPRASGASIRNFGMIWPIGQAAGEFREAALESRRRWLELGEVAGVWVNPCGSIHLAHRPDEWVVLQEFAAQAPALGYECELLSAAQVEERTPAANPAGLLGGLYSPSELCVNPRVAVRQIPGWLAERFGVRFLFQTEVRRLAECTGGVELETARGELAQYDAAIVCNGADLQTLFPALFAGHHLKLCKLQMLKTLPQAGGWKLGPHLASGLTLRHYKSFEICPSLPGLAQRIAAETPELDRFGIHVMAAQNDAGEIVLGDSHEYDDQIEPFDKQQIDDLILRELRRVIRLPDWTIAERWHGLYTKHAVQKVLVAKPLACVHVSTAVGGAGMTLAFGLAERDWRQRTGR